MLHWSLQRSYWKQTESLMLSFQQKATLWEGVWWTGPTTRGWCRSCAWKYSLWVKWVHGHQDEEGLKSTLCSHQAVCWLCQLGRKGSPFLYHKGLAWMSQAGPCSPWTRLVLLQHTASPLSWLYLEVVPKALAFSVLRLRAALLIPCYQWDNFLISQDGTVVEACSSSRGAYKVETKINIGYLS